MFDPGCSPSARSADTTFSLSNSPWQFAPVSVVISKLSFGQPSSSVVRFFSERPVSLRTSGLRSLNTVPEIQLF